MVLSEKQTCWPMEQKKIKDLKMCIHNYNYLIFNSDAKTHTLEKTSFTTFAGKTECLHVEKCEIRPIYISLYKI